MSNLTAIDYNDTEKPTPTFWQWLPTVAVFAYLPLGALAHLLIFQWGTRAYAPSGLIRMFFCAFVHLFITCPVLGFPLVCAQAKWPDRPSRVLLVIALLSAPFLSLSFYLGNFRDAWQIADAVLAVLPAVTIAVLHFQRQRSAIAFTIVLGVTSFIPLFLIGDVLGPWPTYFSFESQGVAIYTWRALSAAAGIWFALDVTLRERGRELDVNVARAVLAVLATAALLLMLPPGNESWGWRALPAVLLILLAVPRTHRPHAKIVFAVVLLACLLFGVQTPATSWAAPLRLALLAMGLGVFWTAGFERKSRSDQNDCCN